jgi:hypothetical protein
MAIRGFVFKFRRVGEGISSSPFQRASNAAAHPESDDNKAGSGPMPAGLKEYFAKRLLAAVTVLKPVSPRLEVHGQRTGKGGNELRTTEGGGIGKVCLQTYGDSFFRPNPLKW